MEDRLPGIYEEFRKTIDPVIGASLADPEALRLREAVKAALDEIGSVIRPGVRAGILRGARSTRTSASIAREIFRTDALVEKVVGELVEDGLLVRAQGRTVRAVNVRAEVDEAVRTVARLGGGEDPVRTDAVRAQMDLPRKQVKRLLSQACAAGRLTRTNWGYRLARHSPDCLCARCLGGR